MCCTSTVHDRTTVTPTVSCVLRESADTAAPQTAPTSANAARLFVMKLDGDDGRGFLIKID